MCPPNTCCTCGARPALQPDHVPWDEDTGVGDSAPADGGEIPSMLCALDPAATILTPGQSRLFNPNPTCVAPQRDDERIPTLPPEIIEHLINARIFQGGGRVRRDIPPLPPPPQSVLTLNNQTGLINISTQYSSTVDRGQQALATIESRLASAANVQDPAELSRLFEGLATEADTFGRAATMVRDVHIRYGFSEYETINNWVNHLWSVRRAREAGGVNVGASSTAPYRLQGVMLGFSMQGINNVDHDYRNGTGTALKFLLPFIARQVATEWGGEVQVLGLWVGTNTAVAGVPAERVAEFRAEVQRRTIAFLSVDQELPREVTDPMGTPGRRTSDLAARDWLVRNPRNMRLIAGHVSTDLPLSDIQPARTELRVIDALASMTESEMHARGTGRETFTGAVPADSPATGKGARPLLRQPRVLPTDVDPSTLGPINAADYHQGTQVTEEDIREGRLPRPSHEAGHSIAHQRRLLELLSQANVTAQQGDVARAHEIRTQILGFLATPEARSSLSVSGHLSHGQEVSLQQERFPGVYRLALMPEFLNRFFGGKDFYIQMQEYADYKGHNMGNPADKADTLHRLTIDVADNAYRHEYVEALVFTNGGDEVARAYGTVTSDGRTLTPQEIARISHSVTSSFNTVFFNTPHHLMEKVPVLREGRTGMFEGRPFILAQDGTVHVQEVPGTPNQMQDLLATVEATFGQRVTADNVQSLEIVDKFVSVERTYGGIRTDAGTGLVLEVRTATPEMPSGFVPSIVPVRTNTTSAVRVPGGSAPEVVDLAIRLVGQQASDMKAGGVDRPRGFQPGDGTAVPDLPTGTPQADRRVAQELERVQRSMTEGPPPVIDIPFLQRLEATRAGRVGLNAGLFAFGEVGSEGVMQLATGRSRIGNPDFYAGMAFNYGLMVTGTASGEATARMGIAFLDGRALTSAALRTEYTGVRGLGVRGGGILGAVLFTELVHTGRINPRETVATLGTMGGAMVVGSLTRLGLTAGFRSMGLLAASAEAPVPGWGKLAIMAGALVAEFTFMKGISNWRSENALNDREQELRASLGRAMRQFDFTIARGTLTRADDTIDESQMEGYRAALHEVTSSFGDLMMFRFARTTPEGRAYMEAQGSLGDAQGKLNEFLDGYPEIRDEIRANPNQDLQILQRHQTRFREFYSHNPFDTRSPYDSSLAHNRLGSVISGLTSARAAVQRTQTPFQDLVRRNLREAPRGNLPIPFHQSDENFAAGLRTEPLDIYNQFQSYLSARIAYADTVRINGPDTAALESTYAPPAPRPPVVQLDRRPLPTTTIDRTGARPTYRFTTN